ncbi:MAG: dTDP-4-dehydrorhamnose reductase [Nitrospirae bacterium]|nr:dTDP-4-dehydrorhamnose reductase [Nitrospirota bacterium]
MKILLFGKEGQVGWELRRSLSTVGDLVASEQHELDFENPDHVRGWVRRHEPDIIVNAAAYTAVDQAESEPEKAHRINAEAVGVLAEEANRLNAWLVHYSTDYVFDGEKPTPYDEGDAANPLSVYGRTKLEGEERLRARHAKHMIFRTSWVYAARGKNFAKTMLRLAKEREKLSVIADQHGAPTSAELIADVTALALHRALQNGSHKDLAGTYHLVARGETSWHGYAQYVVTVARERGIILKTTREEIYPIQTEAYPLPAKRPRNSRLNVSKLTNTFGVHLPDWRNHVRRLIEELASHGCL